MRYKCLGAIIWFFAWILSTEQVFAIGIENFKLTQNKYDSETTNINESVVEELGNRYRVADWNDLLAFSYYHDIGELYSFFDLNGVMITSNGQQTYSRILYNNKRFNRQYYLDWSDRPGQEPMENFLSHGNIGQLYMGSWHLSDNYILAYTDLDVTSNNCNGYADAGLRSTFYRDTDGDGFGDPYDTRSECSQPDGYVENESDCDDTNASVHPEAEEICDGIDNNCDGATDEDYIARPTSCGEGDSLAAGMSSCENGIEMDNCVPLPPLMSHHIWYVDDDALPDGDGSLAHPFQGLGEALAIAASGDTIHVQAGIYTEEEINLGPDSTLVLDGNVSLHATVISLWGTAKCASGGMLAITADGYSESIADNGELGTITINNAELIVSAPLDSQSIVLIETPGNKIIEATILTIQPESCSACHGYPPPPLAHDSATTGSMIEGAHLAHKGYDCTACHVNNDMPQDPIDGRHPDFRIQIGFDGPASTGVPCIGNPVEAGDLYYAQRAVTDSGYGYKGTNGATIITPDDPHWTEDKEMTCSNIYCHSQAKRIAQGYDLPSASPAWGSDNPDPQGDGEQCNNCHGYPPSFDSHRYHVVRRFGCEMCHFATTRDGRAISDPARHANGSYDVVPAGSFYSRRQWRPLSFDYQRTDIGATCSANLCHQYFNYKDVKDWSRRPQQISDATFVVSQGECRLPAANADLSEETVAVSVRPVCGECVGPYTCDFDWGDGSSDRNVSCDTSHTYQDKVPYPYDPTGTVIGAFDVTWTVRDSFGVTLADCAKASRIPVCPLPNVLPTVAQQFFAGPDPDAYDLCFEDRSIDLDYNIGTHYDSNGVTPGTIRIDWGFVPEQKDTVVEMPITLTDQPSGQVFCRTYPRRSYYTVIQSIRDNHGDDSDFIRGTVRRVKVEKNAIFIR